jgi:hypothetical protein
MCNVILVTLKSFYLFANIFDQLFAGHKAGVKSVTERSGAVVHACDSSYMGGRNWEDHGFRPAQTKSLRDYLNKQAGSGDSHL